MLENFFDPQMRRRAMLYLSIAGFLTVLLLRSPEMSKQNGPASELDLKSCELFNFIGQHAETVEKLLSMQKTLRNNDLAKLSPAGEKILRATLWQHVQNPQTSFSACPDVGLSRLSSSDEASVGFAVLAKTCKPV